MLIALDRDLFRNSVAGHQVGTLIALGGLGARILGFWLRPT